MRLTQPIYTPAEHARILSQYYDGTGNAIEKHTIFGESDRGQRERKCPEFDQHFHAVGAALDDLARAEAAAKAAAKELARCA